MEDGDLRKTREGDWKRRDEKRVTSERGKRAKRQDIWKQRTRGC